MEDKNGKFVTRGQLLLTTGVLCTLIGGAYSASGSHKVALILIIGGILVMIIGFIRK